MCGTASVLACQFISWLQRHCQPVREPAKWMSPLLHHLCPKAKLVSPPQVGVSSNLPSGQIGVNPTTSYMCPKAKLVSPQLHCIFPRAKLLSLPLHQRTTQFHMICWLPYQSQRRSLSKSAHINVQVCKYTRKQIPLHIFSHAIIVLTCYICIL